MSAENLSFYIILSTIEYFDTIVVLCDTIMFTKVRAYLRIAV